MIMKLVREESVPERKDSGARNHEIISLLDEFMDSDMNIASVCAGDRYESKLMYNSIAYYARAYYKYLIRIFKRGDKIYLEKINKED